MLEENKTSNPLDKNSADPWNTNTSESCTLEGILTFLGWLVIIGGAISAFFLGASERWLYAAGAFMSFLCSGTLMLGVSRALKYLEEIKAKLN